MPAGRSAVHRFAGFVAAVLIGSVAAVLAGSPAFADDPITTGAQGPTCDPTTGRYEVVSVVGNHVAAPLTLVNLNGDGLVAYRLDWSGVDLPLASSLTVPAATADSPGWLYLVQRVPGSTTLLRLRFSASYNGNPPTPYNADLTLPGDCRGPATSASASPGTPSAVAVDKGVVIESTCAGAVVKLSNAGVGATSRSFTVRAGGGAFRQSVTVTGGETRTVTVPPDRATAIYVDVGGTTRGPFSWSKPARCEVGVSGRSGCGSLTVTIENRTATRVTARVETSGGGWDVTVAPDGEQPVVLVADKDLVAKVKVGGHTWDVRYRRPGNCPDGGGGGLVADVPDDPDRDAGGADRGTPLEALLIGGGLGGLLTLGAVCLVLLLGRRRRSRSGRRPDEDLAGITALVSRGEDAREFADATTRDETAPTPSEPDPSEPDPSEPDPSEPGAGEPDPSEPVAGEPDPSEPGAD